MDGNDRKQRAWLGEHGPRFRAEHDAPTARLVAMLGAMPNDWGPDDAYFSVDILHTVSAMNGRAAKLPRALFDAEHDAVYEPDTAGFFTRVG